MKNFDEWNEIKKKIESSFRSSVYFRERQIWWGKLGLNVGVEQDGKGKDFARPFLIIKKFNKKCFLALPLSRKNKDNKYYYTFNLNGDYVSALISQIRFMDRKRLMYKIGIINEDSFDEIKKAINIVNLC